MLRPLGGREDEVTGIYIPLEQVTSAQFTLPDPEHVGDYRSCRLLRDSVRLGFRSSAGPFRSFARIAVEPRPYQLVPLLMALKLDPVRVLIADDVGIGKTIEAGLIARELLDRGEIEQLAVLCPPQLAEQWQSELTEKFHIQAELVLSSTVRRLERQCRMGESLFERYPFVVVSTDFIKSDRRRDEFLRTAPEFVIVDEAHTCAFSTDRRSGRHQRHQLISGLADTPDRHLVLVTATPHSGKEEAFRSLLGLLNPDFTDFPQDLSGRENEAYRRELARFFVQRRRADIRHYLKTDTPFPEREYGEYSYQLTPEYRQLFERVLHYAQELVSVPGEQGARQRVRWWSALALLRSLASSPAAAAATLRSRAATADAETVEDADEIGRRTVLDLADNDTAEALDIIPGSDIGEPGESANARRLKELARAADALIGDRDNKLLEVVELVKSLVKDGYSPIVFCRFIPTVEYLTQELRDRSRGIEVVGVTGMLPPAEREERVAQLGQAEKRVLVCTDCLSEGINLQEHFDAVLHYDLSWNPTRHEQRDGRVDRYGQPSPTVRVVTYYGIDNQIDGIVLDVLLRKHQSIRSSLGISVPIPVDTNQIINAVFEGLLLRGDQAIANFQQVLPGLETYLRPQKEALFEEWDRVSNRESRSRTMFAQEGIKTDEVEQELRAAREAVGSGVDVAEFLTETTELYGGFVSVNGAVHFDLKETPRALRDTLGGRDEFTARFELPIREGQLYLTRTHPIVEGVATHVMDTALDPIGDSIATRCGAIRSGQVETRTTLLLLRLRHHIITRRASEEHRLLAEDVQAVAFEGAPDQPVWLDHTAAEQLMYAQPDANIHPQQASEFVRRVIDGFGHLRPHVNDFAEQRAQELLDAHLRVREAAHVRGERRASTTVEAQLPPDVLGIYVYLPHRGK